MEKTIARSEIDGSITAESIQDRVELSSLELALVGGGSADVFCQ